MTIDARLARYLRTVATRLPEVKIAVACAGTPLESSAYQAHKKTFLFVGRDSFRLKLDDSLDEAQKLADALPAHFHVGALGWVKITPGDAPPPPDLLTRWIEESYVLVVPKPKSKPAARAKKR